jgi:hypothetical protein
LVFSFRLPAGSSWQASTHELLELVRILIRLFLFRTDFIGNPLPTLAAMIAKSPALAANTQLQTIC